MVIYLVILWVWVGRWVLFYGCCQLTFAKFLGIHQPSNRPVGETGYLDSMEGGGDARCEQWSQCDWPHCGVQDGVCVWLPGWRAVETRDVNNSQCDWPHRGVVTFGLFSFKTA